MNTQNEKHYGHTNWDTWEAFNTVSCDENATTTLIKLLKDSGWTYNALTRFFTAPRGSKRLTKHISMEDLYKNPYDTALKLGRFRALLRQL